MHREQAIAVLWPDRAPAAAANNLHQALHVARRQLDAGQTGRDCLRLEDDVLSLGGEGLLWVDVDVFRTEAVAALRLGDRGRAEAALELYGGPLLPEDLYEEWTEPTRGELERLREELSLLAEVAGGPVLTPRARDNLPPELTTFIGREAELVEVARLMRRGPLLTLAGPAGCGKTRLALEVAARQREGFRHGVWLVELSSLSQPGLIADAVAAAVGVTLSGRSPVPLALVESLAGREALIVLDNCEHLVEGCAGLVEVLLRGCPELMVLATSREPLQIAGEVVWRVPSLTLPDRAGASAPRELIRAESVRLFVERAAAAWQEFALTPDNAADVVRICHRLDGVPLAIELAAARVGALSPAEIATRLGNSFRVLGRGRRAAQTRQQTLEAALDWSYRLLDDEEATLLRHVSVFAGTFGLDAVEGVCTGDTVELVVRLVAKSMVVAENAAGGPRYRLLEMVRQYARERLGESGEFEALRERHARWYAELPEALGGSIGVEIGLRRLDLETDNLRAALSWLLECDPSAALRLAGSLGNWWLLRGRLHEGREWLESAVERTPQTNAAAADALLRAVPFAARAGDMTQGGRLAERSLAIYRSLGDWLGTSRALHMLGLLAWLVGEFARASGLLAEANGEARLAAAAVAEANAAHALALVAISTGDLERARSALDRALELLEPLPADSRPEFLVVTLGIVPFAAHGGGTPRVVQDESQITFRRAAPRTAAAYVRLNLALLARLEGEPARADVVLGDALARLRAEGDDAGIALTLAAIGRYAMLEGDLVRARQTLGESLALRRRLGDVRGVGLSLWLIAELAAASGDTDRGRSLLERALAMLDEIGDRPALMWILAALAQLELAADRPDAARRWLETALAISEELGARTMRGWTLASLAEADRRAGAHERAARLLEQARHAFERCGSRWGIERCEALERELP